MDFGKPANNDLIDKAKEALTSKGYNVFIVEDKNSALSTIKKIIPSKSSVINGASVSLNEIGYVDYLDSGKSGWIDLHAKVRTEKDPLKRSMLRKKYSVSDYYLGSVHALTTDGQMVIASNSGSQLAPIAFNASSLVFVIGTQKIVSDLNEAFERLEKYVVPLEDKRMMQAYGAHTNISKILIFRDEPKSSTRKVNIILVKEKLGF